MDHLVSTRWGGRVGRYAEFTGAVGRCSDPFACHPVQFAREFEYEAWLRWRFHPNTLHITHSRTQVACQGTHQKMTAVATFVVTDRGGLKHYHLVFGKTLPSAPTRALQRVANRTGAIVIVTSRADLRRDVALFWRLELLRQAAQVHEGEGAEMDLQLLAAVRFGAGNREAIKARLHHLDGQLIDARLAHLHCQGRLVLDFRCDDFGVHLVQGSAE